MERVPGITESSLPTPLTLEPDREVPPSSCLPPETQNFASAPAPTPIQSTSCNVIAAPGAVSFPFPTDDPQGAAFTFSCPDPLGAVIFPPLPPIAPGLEAGLEAPAHQAPRRGSAPCLPVLVSQGAAPRAPPGNNRETVTPASPPPPHELRGELRKFLEDVRGTRNKVQLALQRWEDFFQILRTIRALMGEGKGTGKQDAAAYWRVHVFHDQLLTYGMGQGMSHGPLGDASVPASEDPPRPSRPLTIATLNTRGCRMALCRSHVLSFLREGGYSVIFLQETHTDPTTEDSWRLEWGDRVYFSHSMIQQAGVATLFSPKLRPEVLGVAEAMQGCLLHLQVRGLVVNLVNVYAPTSGSERLQFYQQASAFLGTLDSHECLLLGGDFNTTLGDRAVPRCRGHAPGDS
ncbi:unnamed protein product [Eretmochelys imbricata]